MSVSLPPGMNQVKIPRRASDGIPFGAGRPMTPDPEIRFYMAKCETARGQTENGGGPGRFTIFADDAELMHSCREYMLWIDNNPLYETQKKFSSKTCKFYDAQLPKKRPYTVGGMCLYLGISTTSWDVFRRDERFKPTTQVIDDAIRNQKFEGAASGFFNPAIIARDLGLVDKQEMTNKGGLSIETINRDMTAEEAAEAYAKTREANS